jgi:hypothetical protein
MKKKFLYFFQIFFTFIFFSILSNYSLAANITGDNTISSDSSTQQKFNADDTSLTITGSSTLDRNTGQKPIHINEKSNGTVTIHSGSSAVGTANTIAGDDTTGLTVNNSGTITSTGAKAINLLDSTDASIVNNSGGIINSKTNAISISKNGTTPDNITITNSGTIYTTNGSTNTIVFHSSATDSTITNNSGGHIYNTSTNAVIAIGKTTTLTNSGKIENKQSPSEESIKVQGGNNTIILKDGGIVIGTIQNSSANTNTLKIQHGVGQGYFYETSGSGTFNLEDADGNQIVQGSAGSVGQGGNENIDELLGYKSLNIRKSLNKFLKSEGFKNKKTEWQGIQATSLERKENTKNLALGYEFYSLGVNIIRPLENENIIASFEYSEQDFQKDHDIARYNISFGVHFNESENKFKDNSFILAGATLNEGKRKILTNTTSSGTLDITDTYESFEIHTGKMFQNKSLLPNIGTNLSYSFTPSHTESKYYSWEDKHVANFSVDLNDEYNLEFKKNKSKIGIGWILDYRTLITDSKTEYSVNGTEATYHQDDELIKEMTLSVNINYEKTFYKFGKMLVSIDGKTTTQDVNSIGANISFVKAL